MPVSDTTREAAAALVRRYPVARSALLPLLHLVQADHGHITDEGITFCAESLGLTKAEVGAVATFYTMFKRQPVGDWLLSVCTNPTCKIAGAQQIYDSYVEACGGGHVDPDGEGVMVEHAECLGICDAAPVVQINYEMFGPVTQDEATALLTQSKAGDPPASNWSGEVPRTFREVERELSGIDDGVDVYLAEAAKRQATESAVAPALRWGETDIPVTHPGGDPAGHGGRAFRQSAGLGDDGYEEAAGARKASPSEPVAAGADGQNEVVEQLADTGDDVEGDLARTAVSEPVGHTPASQDQPSTPGEATPASSTAEDVETGVASPAHTDPADSETPADADAVDPADTDSAVDTQNPTPSETPDTEPPTDDEASDDEASDVESPDEQNKES